MNETNYTLIATNKQGATLVQYGSSVQNILLDLDSKYYRKGWKILVVNDDTGHEYIIKDTFR